MSIKPKINSLRCQKWYGFSKQKLGILKELGIATKAYVIDGYHILLKVFINLAVIKAPPGLAVFHKADGAVDIYYADMYGKGKEKPVKINALRDFFGGKPLNPSDDGWPGNILVQTFGGWDAMRLLFGGKPKNLTENPAYFTQRSGLNLHTIPGAPYAVGFDSGFLSVVDNTSLPHVWCLANIGEHYAFVNYGEVRLYDTGFTELYFGWGKNKPAGTYVIFDNVEIPKENIIGGSDWQNVYVQYAYLWRHFNAVKNRDVARVVFFVEGVTPPYREGMAAMFFEIDPKAPYPTDFGYVGYTSHTAIYGISPFDEKDNATDIVAYDFSGAPTTQASEVSGLKNVVMPLSNGELLVVHCEPPDITYPLGRQTQLVLNPADNPYKLTTLNIPYVYSEYKNPFCIRTTEFPTALYLYWEEELAYGGQETNIVNMKFGSPYASWVAMPSFDEGAKCTNFAVYRFTWEHRVVLATVYKEGDPEDGGGMFTALLDTEVNPDWVFGRRFAVTRLDRCTPVIFGEHPYALKAKDYGGTQFGWDYSYSRNYPEPPGGYP